MRVLIAEDEVSTAKALKLLLEKEKITVDIVHNGTDALSYAFYEQYDFIVLDIMMPGLNGLEVLSRIRDSHMNTPVLLLTAKGEVEDRVAGLNAGADDYLPKPFATSELIARVKALARRNETYADTVMRYSNLTLDGNRYEMYTEEESVRLNNKEYQLMELFIRHPRFVFSTEHLMERIWGYDSDSEIDVVWTTIGYVRKKLKSIHANVEIRTIRGAGYSLEVSEC